ncbi:DUF3488 and transglutaminase-like domain-containing protein [Simiduia sp. 21SJ11W-1]|uniref:transglutaminase family protein n=1 Tax=Simiduia sp. 21SJ11W-1 TaxID=2909669 RepID=UPI0020A0D079|nr:DUF3488 and transglutaminase-like domain-containing protein [Simiduia sp. 21SJ11W-1]UTA49292.1 DUF3488 and transglutaminase-like domain-containing protein [Simiduia sp. 21SJ11W-1]
MLIDQIPRTSQLWLLFALVWTVVPHLTHLPVWVWGAGLVIIFWRWQIYAGQWSMPGRIMKTLLVLVCAFGIWRGYGSWRGVEPMTGLLLVGMLLKLLEMKTRRDALLVVYLGYFVAAAQLLFAQLILDSLYAAASFWALLCAQQLLFSGRTASIGPALKRSGVMALQALPVMVALFLVMPRTGPLWAMPMQKHAARTGISDTMAPGDVVDLTKSGKLAFRVNFDGDIPPPPARYWRGLVLSQFDGRTWRARNYDFSPGGRGVDLFNQQPSPWRMNEALLPPETPRYSYQVLMEPSHRPWLFTLGLPLEIESNKRWAITADHTVHTLIPVSDRQRFSVVSADLPVPAETLHPFVERHYLALPMGYNPRTRDLASEWQRMGLSAPQIIARFEQMIGEQFIYTLQPPALGNHSVDDFLFGTKQGFCEHFASSFVFFMRAAGVPARVVTGYQGGELGLAGDYLLVHQMDAHAWAEVWINGQWLRVDPTAAVAPSRIRDGLRASLGDGSAELGEPLSLIRYSNINWLNQARLQWEEVNYRWQSMVVGFDSDQQSALLKRLLGGVDPWRIGVFLLLAAGLPLVLLALWLAWRNRAAPLPPLLRLLANIEKKVGEPRAAGEPVGQYFARLGRAYPAQAGLWAQLAALFERGLYDDKNTEAVRLIKAQLARIKRPAAGGEMPVSSR